MSDQQQIPISGQSHPTNNAPMQIDQGDDDVEEIPPPSQRPGTVTTSHLASSTNYGRSDSFHPHPASAAPSAHAYIPPSYDPSQSGAASGVGVTVAAAPASSASSQYQSGFLTGVPPAVSATAVASATALPPPSLPPLKRAASTSTKPRAPRGSKKAKLEGGGATADGDQGGEQTAVEKPPMQRTTSSRARSGTGGGGGGGGGSSRNSNAMDREHHAPPPAFHRPNSSSTREGGGSYYVSVDPSTSGGGSYMARRERVICIVPGCDTMKIGFADSNRPTLVRQMIAYRVPPPTAGTAPSEPIHPIKKEEQMDGMADEEMKDVNFVPPQLPPPVVTEPSDLDVLFATNERDEAELTEFDRNLLARWRRKRENDLADLEKALSSTSSTKKQRKDISSSIRLVPGQGSIHDPENATVQIVANTNALPPLHPPRVLHANTLLGAHAPVMTPTSRYLLRQPFQRGGFHLTSAIPIKRVIDWCEEILKEACKTHLNISGSSQYSQYSISLVVPDTWHSHELSEYVELLLIRFGFKEIFLCRESVAACFGGGLATACVVDLGATKTTITCIEDGILNPRSSLTLNYGGRDVDELLRSAIADKTFWATQERLVNEAELRGVAEENLVTLRLAEQIRLWKEQFSYCLKLDEDTRPPLPNLPVLPFAAHPHATLPYTVPNELYFPAAIAPLAFFHPSLFHSVLHVSDASYRLAWLEGARARDDPHLEVLTTPAYTAHLTTAADPYAPTLTRFDPAMLDEELILARRHQRLEPPAPPVLTKVESLSSSTSVPFKLDRRRKDHQLLLQTYTEEQLMAGQHLILEREAEARAKAEELAKKQAEELTITRSVTVPAALTNPNHPPTPVEIFLAHRQPLHVAISQSIKLCTSNSSSSNTNVTGATNNSSLPPSSAILEAQQRLTSSILITGGGANFPQLYEALQERLTDLLPTHLPGITSVNCILHPKGLDSSQLSWRGGAILAKAETIRDLWFSGDEWKRYGTRLFREKAPFGI